MSITFTDVDVQFDIQRTRQSTQRLVLIWKA